MKVTVLGRAFAFEVDTGASNTIIDESVATELGLKAVGPAISGSTVGCTNRSQPRQVASWSIGGQSLPSATVITTKTELSGEKIGGLMVGGLLGADVAAAFGSVGVDYASKTVQLGGPSPTGGTIVPVEVMRAKGEVRAVARATVHGIPAAMVVDTGASSSVVDATLAAQAGLTHSGDPRSIKSVSCITTVQPVTIDQFAVGAVTFPAVDGIIASLPSSSSDAAHNLGLLGSDVFATYGRVVVDFADGKLVLGK